MVMKTNRKLTRWLPLLIAILGIVGLIVSRSTLIPKDSQPTTQLTVLMEDYWGRLSPVHQSTSNADTLLGNAFDPLVDLNSQGGIVPGVAQRWEISDDDRTFRFHLRQDARFSDGTPLTADLYLRSLLLSVASDDRDSHNPNALDVLYRLKGFSIQNARQMKVPGLRVEKDGALVFEFKSPFRTALFELTGTRYAAWIVNPSTKEILGTGSYRIARHIENERVEYEPNPFSWKKPSYGKVIVSIASNGYLDLCSKKGQVYLGRSLAEHLADQACKSSQIEFQGGAISGHSLISVNALPGKLFSDPKLRWAIQHAIQNVVPEALPGNVDARRFSIDPQFFPPLWPGRLEASEVNELLAKGKNYLGDLVEATRTRPIHFLAANENQEGVQRGLEAQGIRFTRPFQVQEVKTVVEAMYGRHDYDLNAHGAMVVGNDPDGLFHLLGSSGALNSPAILRPGVARAMETARGATHRDSLHPFYEKAARAIFEEVPAVHVGFMRGGTFFDSQKVRLEDRGLNSDRFQFDSFIQKE